MLIFKSPHYSHFLLSIKHDEVLKTAAVLPNKSWTKEKTNLEALLSFFNGLLSLHSGLKSLI